MPTKDLKTQVLRAKTLGDLLKAARQNANKTTEACAQLIGLSLSDYEDGESGKHPLSLPELEVLAFYLQAPLETFFQQGSGGEGRDEKTLNNAEQLMHIRNRMIGALLRQARQEAGFSLEGLAERTGIELTLLESYELGLAAIPLPELEALTSLLHRSIREFLDMHGPVGVWSMQQRAMKDFLAMPLELQLFVSKPVNRPYLELAIRLNDMSVEKLRGVAEGLLEITY